jgi:hypothetical protein
MVDKVITYTKNLKILAPGLGFVCNTIFFLQLLIIDFVNNFHESSYDEMHGGVFILHVYA